MTQRIFAVDIDGVIMQTVLKIQEHLRVRWSIDMPVAEISHDIGRLTQHVEVNQDLIKQFSNPHFYQGIPPYPGTFKALEILNQYGLVVCVTSRPVCVRGITALELERLFPGLVRTVEHTKQDKWKIAKVCGATHAVDDNLNECLKYAKKRYHTTLIQQPYNRLPYRRDRFIREAKSLLDMAEQFDLLYHESKAAKY